MSDMRNIFWVKSGRKPSRKVMQQLAEFDYNQQMWNGSHIAQTSNSNKLSK